MSAEEEFSLPEMRERLRLVFGGISAWHVVRESTWPASAHPGKWTRKAWDRRALCGALPACVVGGDAADFPDDLDLTIPLDRITCRRCRDAYERRYLGDP